MWGKCNVLIVVFRKIWDLKKNIELIVKFFEKVCGASVIVKCLAWTRKKKEYVGFKKINFESNNNS